MTRLERRRQETYEVLYWAAIDLFEANGYIATTIQEIAQQAKIARRTFFTYFSSKKAVLFTDLEKVSSAFIGQLLQPDRTTPTSVVLREFLESLIRFPPHYLYTASDVRLYTIIFRTPELHSHVQAMRQRLVDACALSYAKDMNRTVDDPRAMIAAEVLISSVWIVGPSFFPYQSNFTMKSIDSFFSSLDATLRVIL